MCTQCSVLQMGKHGNEVELGFVAQEVETLFPELVGSFRNPKLGDDSFLSLRYDRFAPVVVEAIQEQHREVHELRDRVAALERQNAELLEAVRALMQQQQRAV